MGVGLKRSVYETDHSFPSIARIKHTSLVHHHHMLGNNFVHRGSWTEIKISFILSLFYLHSDVSLSLLVNYKIQTDIIHWLHVTLIYCSV
jgi:hypothetical protein